MNPRRVLFIAEGQLGDLLLLTPALRAMKESFPSASIAVLILERRSYNREEGSSEIIRQTQDQSATVLSTNPNIDQLFLLDRPLITSQQGIARFRVELEVIRFLREKQFDTVICTFPEDRFALWAFASGANVRIGQKEQSLSWLLTHRPEVRKQDRGVLQYYCDLVRIAGAQVESDRTEYIVPDTSEQWAHDFLRSHGLDAAANLVAVHPGATGNYKIWPADRYASLIDTLQSDAKTTVVLCHGLHDARIIKMIRDRLRTKIVAADTGSSVGHLAALLRKSALCISNDSGPRHLAVAVGTPSLALFRQFREREWGIYGSRSNCVILQGSHACSLCPAGLCMDKLPEGEEFASFCLRMVTVEQAAFQAKKVLDFPKNK